MDDETYKELGTLLHEEGEALKESCTDPLEGYIYKVQSDLRKRVKPFPEKFARGAQVIFDTILKKKK